MTSIASIRYVGGFARAATISSEQYQLASPDPISPFAHFIINHMNEDHRNALQDIVHHFVQIPVQDVKMTAVDRLGMTVSYSHILLSF